MSGLARARWMLPIGVVAGIVLAAATGGADPAGGRLEGTVRSRETGELLAGSNVLVLDTVLGAAADRRGFFFIEGIPPGAYRIKATRIGYAPEILGVEIRAGDTTGVEFILAETAIPISEVVVSAGKIEQSLAEAPGSVSVVGRETLEQRAATSLENVLPMVSGVDLRFGQVSIRGSTGFNRGAGSRVLLLIDGFPAVTGDTGGINWDLVPLWEIDRVEVLKGGSSALYGSNAVGGVINVITRAPTRGAWTKVSLHAGWFAEPMYPEWRWTSDRRDFNGADVVHSRQLGRTRILLSAAERQSQGYRQNNSERRLRSMGRLETDLTPRLKGELFVSAGTTTYGYFQEWWSQGRALEVRPEARGDRVRSDKMNLAGKLSWARSDKLILVIEPAWYRTRWRDFFHDGDEFSDADKVGVETRVHRSVRERHLLVAGLAPEIDLIDSNMFGNRRSSGLGGFAQDEVRLGESLKATLGVRWDSYRVRDGLHESQLSPKLAAVWQEAPGRSFRLSVARGFRAPSMAERFTRTSVGGITIVPNPDLRAESVWSGEAGFVAGLGRRGSLSAALFENRYRDLIQAEGALDGIRFENTGEARVRGLDLDLDVRLWGGLSSRAGYCYQDPRNTETGEKLPYRPEHSLAVSLEMKHGPAAVGADFRYQSKVDSVVAYPADERVPLYLVNVRSSVDVGPLSFSFTVENLLQYHFTPIERNLAPIRSYTLSATGEW